MAKKKYDRGLILRTAFKLSKEIGLEAISMRMLARELGCSVMPIYDAFESKEDLIAALGDFCVMDTMFELKSKTIYERYEKMTWYGIKHPKFFLDYVSLGGKQRANEETINLLSRLMRNEKELEFLTTKELLSINGRIEVFIIGVIFISMNETNKTDDRVNHLLKAVDEVAHQIIRG